MSKPCCVWSSCLQCEQRWSRYGGTTTKAGYAKKTEPWRWRRLGSCMCWKRRQFILNSHLYLERFDGLFCVFIFQLVWLWHIRSKTARRTKQGAPKCRPIDQIGTTSIPRRRTKTLERIGSWTKLNCFIFTINNRQSISQ